MSLKTFDIKTPIEFYGKEPILPMKKFIIYAGLLGKYGGAKHIEEAYFINADEALEYARNIAIEEYENYEGNGEILNWYEVKDILINSGYKNVSDADIFTAYLEEVESWIEYWIEEIVD